MRQALLPDPAARERLRRACEEDLKTVPVWIATEGGAAMQTTGKEIDKCPSSSRAT